MFAITPGVHESRVNPETFVSLFQWVQDAVEAHIPYCSYFSFCFKTILKRNYLDKPCKLFLSMFSGNLNFSLWNTNYISFVCIARLLYPFKIRNQPSTNWYFSLLIFVKYFKFLTLRMELKKPPKQNPTQFLFFTKRNNKPFSSSLFSVPERSALIQQDETGKELNHVALHGSAALLSAYWHFWNRSELVRLCIMLVLIKNQHTNLP